MIAPRKPGISPGIAISLLVSLAATCGVFGAGLAWIIWRHWP